LHTWGVPAGHGGQGRAFPLRWGAWHEKRSCASLPAFPPYGGTHPPGLDRVAGYLSPPLGESSLGLGSPGLHRLRVSAAGVVGSLPWITGLFSACPVALPLYRWRGVTHGDASGNPHSAAGHPGWTYTGSFHILDNGWRPVKLLQADKLRTGTVVCGFTTVIFSSHPTCKGPLPTRPWQAIEPSAGPWLSNGSHPPGCNGPPGLGSLLGGGRQIFTPIWVIPEGHGG